MAVGGAQGGLGQAGSALHGGDWGAGTPLAAWGAGWTPHSVPPAETLQKLPVTCEHSDFQEQVHETMKERVSLNSQRQHSPPASPASGSPWGLQAPGGGHAVSWQGQDRVIFLHLLSPPPSVEPMMLHVKLTSNPHRTHVPSPGSTRVPRDEAGVADP